MEKLVYLLWASNELDADKLRDALLRDAAPKLIESGATQLAMNFNDSGASAPAPTPTPPGSRELAAQVSFFLDCVDRRDALEQTIREFGADVDAYLVSESLYMDYGGNRHAKPRDWPDGERSPGITVVTLMERPERMTQAQWIAHWHGTQSPMSEEMQPRTRYVRNEVVRALTAEAPPYRGIVEESWASAEVITNPMLFYGANGSQETLGANIKTMLESVTAFLDLERIHTTTMSEYFVKS